MSRVSVLIPNYQGEKWIEKTIQSCLQQKWLLEIIVVDDGSTDESLFLLKKLESAHPDVIRVYRNQSKGGNNARNHAFSLSKGEFIQWLDVDDQIEDGKFQAQVECFDGNGQLDIVYSDWKLLTYTPDFKIINREVIKNRAVEDFVNELLFNRWSPPHCYLLKREAAAKLHELQAWNPDTYVLQDREYFTVAAIHGFKFGYTEGIYCIYNRWSINSVSAARADIKYSATEKILTRFEEMIKSSLKIDNDKKKEYLNIIYTERILLRALGYPAKIDQAIKWRHVRWSMIKGVRTNMKFLWETLKLRF
jgi:glycosyltransferase involved in cell wall biosynthesis